MKTWTCRVAWVLLAIVFLPIFVIAGVLGTVVVPGLAAWYDAVVEGWRKIP